MINFYVYLYSDPISRIPFYVGKGQKYRYRSHLKPINWSDPNNTTNPMFYWKINRLMTSNTKPIITFPATNLTEKDALYIEASIIKLYGRRFVGGGLLFNISDGYGGRPAGLPKPKTEKGLESYRAYCKTTRKFDPTYDEMVMLYITNNMTRKSIADKYRVSDVLVKKRLAELNIKKPKHKIETNRLKAIMEYWND